jgi:hypothetical protein
MKGIRISIRFSLLFFFLIGLSILSSAQEQDAYQLKQFNNEVYNAIIQFYEYDREIPIEPSTVAKAGPIDHIPPAILTFSYLSIHHRINSGIQWSILSGEKGHRLLQFRVKLPLTYSTYFFLKL